MDAADISTAGGAPVARELLYISPDRRPYMETQNITAVPEAIYSPAPIAAEQFVDGIRRLSEGIITKQKIYDYLVAYEIRPDELERYKSWQPDRHTRNKIFRNDMIEVMVICWPEGAVTPLHTHNGQLGWMTMIEGQL